MGALIIIFSTNFIAILISSKLLKTKINKDRICNENVENKIKNLPFFFILKSPTDTDFLISKTKKSFKLSENGLINILIFTILI